MLAIYIMKEFWKGRVKLVTHWRRLRGVTTVLEVSNSGLIMIAPSTFFGGSRKGLTW